MCSCPQVPSTVRMPFRKRFLVHMSTMTTVTAPMAMMSQAPQHVLQGVLDSHALVGLTLYLLLLWMMVSRTARMDLMKKYNGCVDCTHGLFDQRTSDGQFHLMMKPSMRPVLPAHADHLQKLQGILLRISIQGLLHYWQAHLQSTFLALRFVVCETPGYAWLQHCLHCLDLT